MNNGARDCTIGKRSALKHFKTAGLVEEDTLCPKQAAQDVQVRIREAALCWYRKGAERGAEELVKALLRGDIELKDLINGRVKVTKTSALEIATRKGWSKRLNVTVGNFKQRTQKQHFELTVRATAKPVKYRTMVLKDL
jgi:hypothetical protein